uniref:Nickel import ATP-binding protein NikE n=1 Tax=Arsenophonus endosymbiont of Trialeurodes vaporariorum TaxID=235567 RepID=A0A3B0M1S3_9GAMM
MSQKIELQNITLKTQRLLVQDVSLTINKGKVLALVGSSGCGKSKLARLLVGLISPSCGEIRWCGTSLTKLKGKAISQFRKDVQIVFQDQITAVNPRKTIDEIIREPIRHLLSLTKKEQHARITKMLNAVELDSFLLNQRPPQLRGGQLQLVCLARAMVVEPKLLILDEAVSNLDLILQAEIIQLLKNLQQQFHTACLFITHDLRLVEHLCQQIMIMKNGQIIET